MSTYIPTVVCVLIAAALFTPIPLGAQSGYQSPYLQTELFAGFSTTALAPGRIGDKNISAVRLNGWNFSATSYHFFRRWGLTAEAAGYGGNQDGVDASTRTYLFGGTFRGLDKRRFAITGRIRAGLNRWAPAVLPAGGYREQTGVVFGFGQALDIKLNENIAFRAQPDFLFIRREPLNEERRFLPTSALAFGLVLKFGNR